MPYPFKNMIAPRDDHLRAIGMVAVQWALLELGLNMLIWEMAPLKELRALAFTTHMNERTRADIAKSLAHEIFPGNPLEKELIDLLNHVMNGLYPDRNKFVHSVYAPCTDITKIGIQPIKARGQIKIGAIEEFSADDIEMVAGRIEEAFTELLELHSRVSAYIRTLPNWP